MNRIVIVIALLVLLSVSAGLYEPGGSWGVWKCGARGGFDNPRRTAEKVLSAVQTTRDDFAKNAPDEDYTAYVK